MTKKKENINYPSWKSLLYDLLDEYLREHPEYGVQAKAAMTTVMERIEKVRSMMVDYLPARIRELLGSAEAKYIPKENFHIVLDKIRNIPISHHEFYSSFDMRTSDFTIVDPNIRNVLGIEPEQFNIRSLLGLDPANPLFHPHDVNHWIRWSALGYLMLGLPIFSYESMRNCFQVGFRVNSECSSIEALRKAKYVLLSQRAYPHFERGDDGNVKPSYHLDHWSVLPAPASHYVRPDCITEWQTQEFTNAMIYLLNAFLLDMPSKYVLMLNARIHTDRNKEIANSMNEMMKTLPDSDLRMDDTHVGNYFAKTIRPKLGEIVLKWDKSEADKNFNIVSDKHAVECAMNFGIIPIPDKVKTLLLQGVQVA